jgi:hypothetical protein
MDRSIMSSHWANSAMPCTVQVLNINCLRVLPPALLCGVFNDVGKVCL